MFDMRYMYKLFMFKQHYFNAYALILISTDLTTHRQSPQINYHYQNGLLQNIFSNMY